MRACELLEGDCLVQMLKAVKHLSMNANLLEVLQNANAIEILIKLLDEDRAGPHGTVSPSSDVRVSYLLCTPRKFPTTSSKHATTSVD
jgi:hypothetical protein